MEVRLKLLEAGGVCRWVDRYLRVVLRSTTVGTYTEGHHILPQCMFPEYTKEKWNLVRLTGREHYVAHLLLSYAFPSHHGLATAAALMMNGVGVGRGVGRYSSRVYESVRARAAQLSSERWTGVSRCAGDKNPSWGLFGPANPRFGQKRSITQAARITVGLRGHLQRLASDPEYREENRAKILEAMNRPEARENARDAKLGEKNPNYGKNITGSFTEEQRIRQAAAIKAAHLKKMPWESSRWKDEKDVYWRNADRIALLLVAGSPKPQVFLELFGDKSVRVWNACGPIIDKLNSGWDPLSCEKWLARYKEHVC